MRRMLLLLSLVAVVLLGVLAANHPALGTVGQEATPAATTEHPLVGAWRVVPDPPGPPLVLIVYHADGTLVYSGPALAPAPQGSPARLVFDTPAFGVWEPTGDRSAALTASLIETDEQGTFLGTLTFHGTVDLDDARNAYRFAGVVEVADPSGVVVATAPVSTRATRLQVDPARAMAGTPVAGTPVP